MHKLVAAYWKRPCYLLQALTLPYVMLSNSLLPVCSLIPYFLYALWSPTSCMPSDPYFLYAVWSPTSCMPSDPYFLYAVWSLLLVYCLISLLPVIWSPYFLNAVWFSYFLYAVWFPYFLYSVWFPYFLYSVWSPTSCMPSNPLLPVLWFLHFLYRNTISNDWGSSLWRKSPKWL